MSRADAKRNKQARRARDDLSRGVRRKDIALALDGFLPIAEEDVPAAEFDAARDAYLAAVTIAPAMEPAWLELGRLYSALGERGNALAALQVAMMLGGPWQAEAKAAFDEISEESAVL